MDFVLSTASSSIDTDAEQIMTFRA